LQIGQERKDKQAWPRLEQLLTQTEETVAAFSVKRAYLYKIEHETFEYEAKCYLLNHTIPSLETEKEQ